MSAKTAIEWTDATWNPVRGCDPVSPGCKNCYAETLMDKRYHRVKWGLGKQRQRTREANWKLPLKWNREAEKSGIRPLVFCASLSDWLDDEVPVEWFSDLLDLVAER